MKNQIFFTVAFIILAISCRHNKVDLKKDISTYDTVFYETEKKVDTFLLTTAKQNESIWINSILYKKQVKNKFFIIASSLSHNNSIFQIDNQKDTVNPKILGSNVRVEVKKFKDYDFIIAQDSSYSFGDFNKITNTFLLNEQGQLLHNEEFILTSKDNGKTFDKDLETISNKDTIFLKYKAK